MPISISPSPMVKVGFPTRGTVQGESATPMVRRLASACSAAPATSSRLPPRSAFAPATLKAKTIPATPRLRAASAGRRRGDVVAHQDGANLDILHGRHLGGHVEVHDVAAVVPVDIDDALAAMDPPGHVEHGVAARRIEHVADGAAVEQAAADVAEEHRQVPGPAAGGERHLALHRRVGAHDRDRLAGERQLIRMRLDQSVEHLGDEVLGSVDQLLHGFLLSALPSRRAANRRLQASRVDRPSRATTARPRSCRRRSC